jgi:hypothetical protein
MLKELQQIIFCVNYNNINVSVSQQLHGVHKTYKL